MDSVIAIVIFVLGLAFGSFLNVCIHRVPRRMELQDALDQARARLEKMRIEGAPEAELLAGRAEVERLDKEVAGFSVVHPQSACPKCHQPIRPYDNIPVVSWLLLGGRCRDCRTPISPRYIAVELLTGLLFLACYWRFGLTLATLKFCVFSFLIVGLTFIDAEWKLLPDALTLPGIAAGLGFSFVVSVYDVVFSFAQTLLFQIHRVPRWWPFGMMTSLRLGSFLDSLLGAVVGASFFYFIAIAYKHLRGREGMGLGDVKLMAMVGAFLGMRLTVLTIFGASLVGSIFGLATILTVWTRRTKRRITKCHEPREVARKRAWASAKLMYRYYGLPFGVFLGPMSLLALFFGRTLLGWYWGLY